MPICQPTNSASLPSLPMHPQDSFALVDALAANVQAWRRCPPRL